MTRYFLGGLLLSLVLASPLFAGPLLPPVQFGNVLNTGRANFYWKNSLKISGFYAGVGLESYLSDNIYTNHTWTVTGNQVEITSTRGELPTMKQVFILDQDDS